MVNSPSLSQKGPHTQQTSSEFQVPGGGRWSQGNSRHQRVYPPSWSGWSTAPWANKRLRNKQPGRAVAGSRTRTHICPHPASSIQPSQAIGGSLRRSRTVQNHVSFPFFKYALFELIQRNFKKLSKLPSQNAKLPVSNWVSATQASLQFLFVCHSVWGPLPLKHKLLA